MNGFYKAVGYTFKNELLAKEALTHSSYANEFGVRSYERLEFLGDSILSVVVSEYLYENFPDMPEGELTKVRAASVCERSLYEVASGLSMGNFLFLNKGEEATGGRRRVSILADIVEATIAAIYLDSGMDEAKSWIMKNVKPVIDKAVSGKAFKDYKTELQEIAQSGALEVISYRLVKEEGPAHMKTFSFEVYSGDKCIGKGSAGSKKEAEQLAAKSALEAMYE